jgi:uncharacterized protein (UPF0254 family)
VAIVISNGIRATFNASVSIAINANRIGNGATTVALCVLELVLTATPLSCGMGAAIGDGGHCKPTKKARYVFEGGTKKDFRSLAARPAGAFKIKL